MSPQTEGGEDGRQVSASLPETTPVTPNVAPSSPPRTPGDPASRPKSSPNRKKSQEKEEDAVNPDDTRCFFDITIGAVKTGRIVFQLFHDIVPKTARNFQSLCSGEAGLSAKSERPLHYRGSIFHRVIKGFMLQGGDFVNHNGSGGESIYGQPFADENLEIEHDRPFLLSMANRGPNTNGSQFFITTEPAPHLNGLHVVFGHVVSGKEVVREIEDLQTDKLDRPLQDVKIANCGILVLKNKKKNKVPVSSHKSEGKKKKKKRSAGSSSSSSSSSSSEPSSDEEKSRSKKKKSKKKKKKKNKKKNELAKGGDEEGEVSSNNEGEVHPLAQITNIDPDEIPEVPENRFLYRGDKKPEASSEPSKKRISERNRRSKSRSNSRDRARGRFSAASGSKSGSSKKIKGRGRMHFRPRDWSRSRSRTPPHWRNETKKTITLAEFEKNKKEEKKRQEEMNRRAEERQKRHEQREREIQKRILERELSRRKESEKSKPREPSVEKTISPKLSEIKTNPTLDDVRDFDKLDYEANESDPEDKRRSDEAIRKRGRLEETAPSVALHRSDKASPASTTSPSPPRKSKRRPPSRSRSPSRSPSRSRGRSSRKEGRHRGRSRSRRHSSSSTSDSDRK